MPANLRKLMGESPRAFDVISKDAADDKPLNRKAVSKHEVARRLEPLMAMVASGEIPVDNQTAEAIKTYVEHARGQIEH